MSEWMIKYNDSDSIKRSSGIHPQLFSLKKVFGRPMLPWSYILRYPA